MEKKKELINEHYRNEHITVLTNLSDERLSYTTEAIDRRQRN